MQNILGPDVDCFLSQYIFKNPVLGVAMAPDSSAFLLTEPQVGAWLATTEATLENGYS